MAAGTASSPADRLCSPVTRPALSGPQCLHSPSEALTLHNQCGLLGLCCKEEGMGGLQFPSRRVSIHWLPQTTFLSSRSTRGEKLGARLQSSLLMRKPQQGSQGTPLLRAAITGWEGRAVARASPGHTTEGLAFKASPFYLLPQPSLIYVPGTLPRAWAGTT